MVAEAVDLAVRRAPRSVRRSFARQAVDCRAEIAPSWRGRASHAAFRGIRRALPPTRRRSSEQVRDRDRGPRLGAPGGGRDPTGCLSHFEPSLPPALERQSTRPLEVLAGRLSRPQRISCCLLPSRLFDSREVEFRPLARCLESKLGDSGSADRCSFEKAVRESSPASITHWRQRPVPPAPHLATTARPGTRTTRSSCRRSPGSRPQTAPSMWARVPVFADYPPRDVQSRPRRPRAGRDHTEHPRGRGGSPLRQSRADEPSCSCRRAAPWPCRRSRMLRVRSARPMTASRLARLATVGCFSFHPRKVITTGEGGMVTTNRADLAERIKHLRNHGATGPAFNADPHQAVFDEHVREARLQSAAVSDIQSAVGLAQMEEARPVARRAAAPRLAIHGSAGRDRRHNLPGR